MGCHVMVAGATGLVGAHVVNALLDQSLVASVHCLVRHCDAPIKHPKVQYHMVDFFNLNQSLFTGITHVVCCVGTTMKDAGSREQFQLVDHYIPKEVARLARLAGASSFSLVSSMGADDASRWFYLRVKGAIETHLKGVGFDSLMIYRPSLLLGKRKSMRWGEYAGIVFLWLFGWLMPARFLPTNAKALATLMAKHVVEPSMKGDRIFDAAMIH